MKSTHVLLLLVLAISINSCSNSKSDCVSINEDGIPVIEIENITEKGELAFSDMMKDFQITRLETNEECLIDDVFRRYATQNYLIISTDNNGILLFSRQDGSFIKKIAAYGNGPAEVSKAHKLEYSEYNNCLYVISDYNSTGKIKAYMLPDAKYFTIRINTDRMINDLACIDSIITLTPLSFNKDLRVICQTSSGTELFRIHHTNENNAYYANVYQEGKQLMFNYSHGGNIMYYIKNKRLIPHSIYSVKGELYQGMIQEELGDVSLFLTPLNENIILGSYSKIMDHQSFDNGEYKRPVFERPTMFIFNKDKSSAYLIEKIKDDYLGSEKSFYSKQSNGMFSQYYEIQELFNLRDKANNDPDFPKQIKDRLNSLCDQLDINDNPVLLVAKIK